MNAYKNASYVGIVLFLIGLGLIGYGLVNLGKEKDLDKNGLTVKGIVYEINESDDLYRQAWVKFANQEGDTVRFLDKLFWNKDFNKYEVGEEVEVIYDPSDPISTATINDFFQRNTAAWWPMIIGVILVFLGIIFRRIMLKKAKRYAS